MYPKAKESFLSGAIDLTTANIKLVLVDTGAYTLASSTDQFLSDIPAGARIATSANLAGKSVTLGVFDATDSSFASVTGVQSEVVVMYKDTGNAATSNLILYLDTATGLAVTPDGNNITVTFDNGASKIFAL